MYPKWTDMQFKSDERYAAMLLEMDETIRRHGVEGLLRTLFASVDVEAILQKHRETIE